MQHQYRWTPGCGTIACLYIEPPVRSSGVSIWEQGALVNTKLEEP